MVMRHVSIYVKSINISINLMMKIIFLSKIKTRNISEIYSRKIIMIQRMKVIHRNIANFNFLNKIRKKLFQKDLHLICKRCFSKLKIITISKAHFLMILGRSLYLLHAQPTLISLLFSKQRR